MCFSLNPNIGESVLALILRASFHALLGFLVQMIIPAHKVEDPVRWLRCKCFVGSKWEGLLCLLLGLSLYLPRPVLA